jgi:hypothetical protein
VTGNYSSLLGRDGGWGGRDGEDPDGGAAARGEGRREAEGDVVGVERHPGGHLRRQGSRREWLALERLGCGCGGEEMGPSAIWAFVFGSSSSRPRVPPARVPYLCLFLPWIFTQSPPPTPFFDSLLSSSCQVVLPGLPFLFPFL